MRGEADLGIIFFSFGRGEEDDFCVFAELGLRKANQSGSDAHFLIGFVIGEVGQIAAV